MLLDTVVSSWLDANAVKRRAVGLIFDDAQRRHRVQIKNWERGTNFRDQEAVRCAQLHLLKLDSKMNRKVRGNSGLMDLPDLPRRRIKIRTKPAKWIRS